MNEEVITEVTQPTPDQIEGAIVNAERIRAEVEAAQANDNPDQTEGPVEA